MAPLDFSKTNFKPIRCLQIVTCLLFVLLGIAVIYRQYYQANRYQRLGQQQCLRRILRPGLRGTIYDRNGHRLATHRNSYHLYVDLNAFRKTFEPFCKKHTNADEQSEHLWALVHDALLPIVQQVGPIPFHVSPKKLLQHYQQNILLPLKIGSDLPQSLYAQLFHVLQKQKAFHVDVESMRFYPYGASACHVIGYVTQTTELNSADLPGNDLRTFFLPNEQGQAGIEASYDDQLSGYNGGDIWRVTPAGAKQTKLLSIPSIHGKDVQLSLDIQLQQACEAAMGKLKGSVTIISVPSGAVLALVSKPDFDLNALVPTLATKTFDAINRRGAWMNRALQGLYPPGSTFKLVSLSALLRAGIVNQESQLNCTGSYKIGSRSFKCANHWGHGNLRTVQALQLSCNPFFWHFALQLGANKLHDEACFYYLDRPTGIDLPYETTHACIPSPQWKWKRFHDGWAQGDTANMTIGQGYVLVTPLQMACFAAALAQNRNRCIPYLVHKKSYTTKQALPQKNWALIKDGMAKAGQHYLPNFKAAIKTGTAQVKTANGLYTHIGWMVGFVPIENPQMAFCIAIEQETTEKGFWGGKICAPIAESFLRTFFTNNRNASKALHHTNSQDH